MQYLIFRYLSKADLRSVCLTHSNLRALAEIYLYSEINFGWQEGHEVRRHPITTLLRSILYRPELADHIRTISLVGASFHWSHYKGKTPRILVPETELEEVLTFVTMTEVFYRETWLEELLNGTMEAFVAVLLCQPSHLTNLFIDTDFAKETQIIGLVLRTTLCDTRGCALGLNFRHLKSVSIERYPNDTFDKYQVIRNIADVLPLFYIPSATQISAGIENPVNPATHLPSATFSWPAAQPPTCPNLLVLKVIYMREPYLDQLLSVASQIQSLHWGWYYNPQYEDHISTPIIDLVQFFKAISHLRNTLEELTISIECTMGRDIEPPQLTIEGSFKAIADFDKLKKFTAPLPLLLGFASDQTKQIQESLPRNLEFLTITDELYYHDQYEWEDRDVVGVLEPWLENFQASNPHLRGIALFLELAEEIWNQPIRSELEEICARVGVQIEITKLSDDLYFDT